MTILAGIDEAGLGPYLGPLVVSCAALRVPEEWNAATPWAALAASIAGKATKKDPRPAVCDSKFLYASGGVTSLGKTVFAFLNCNGAEFSSRAFNSRKTFLSAVNADPDSPDNYPWYENTGGFSLPLNMNTQRDSVEPRGESTRHYELLKKDLAAAGASLAMLSARPVMAGEFNQLLEAGLNKNELLLQQTGRHIKTLAEKFSDERIDLMVDKQGGRSYYHAFLTRLFPGEWLEIIEEGKARSAYLLKRKPGKDVKISFEAKADRTAFCVSLASILSKYLRELFVADLNAFFISRVPELKPTAGYPSDAPRFIDAIAPVVEELKLDKNLLVRRR